MSQLRGCLKAILRDSAVSEDDEQGVAILSEKREKGTSPMRVRVGHIPDSTTVVSLQRTSQHPILRQSPGVEWMKICDYVLINESADDCQVVMVELKSSLQKRSEGLKQLRRSLPIAKYILAICEVELQRSWRCQFRYALVAEKRTNRLDKQRTRGRLDLETIDHEDVKVAVGVGTRFDFADLTAAG